MKRTLEIVVSPAGDIQIEAIGFKGSDCERATAFLEKALGVCTHRKRKQEFHQKAAATATQRIQS